MITMMMMVISCRYWCNVDFVYVWIFMTKMSRMKLSFFSHVIRFDFAAIIPHPSAWFPLNATYQTSEIENRLTSGSKKGKVHLSLGPDGTKGGSYFFRDSPASSITFSGSNSKLDIGVSITVLCWLYNYDNNAETTFLQYKGMKLFVNHSKLKLTFPETSISNGLTGTLAEKGWTFVGVSYNKTTAEAKLWIDGKRIVTSKKPTVSFDSQLLKLGGNNFKGKITQLMLFNLTLTQEQIQGIKGRMKLPGETESCICKIKILSRYCEILFLIKDVCISGFNLSLPMISPVTHSFASYRFETRCTSIIPFIYLTSYTKGDFFFAQANTVTRFSLQFQKTNILDKIIKVFTHAIKYKRIRHVSVAFYILSLC